MWLVKLIAISVLLVIVRTGLYAQCGTLVKNPITGKFDCAGTSGVSSVTAGSGITVTGTTTPSVSIDSAVVPNYFTGAGTPSANCTAGAALYLDTTNTRFFRCSATNTWTEVSRITSGSGAPSSSACDSAGEEGTLYYRTDNTSGATAHYGCAETGSGSWGWVIFGGGGGTTNTHTIWLPAGFRNDTVNRSIWQMSTHAITNVGSVPNALIGLQFPDAAVVTAGTTFPLPASWNAGTVNVRVFWQVGSAVNTFWRAVVRMACVASTEDITAPSFNADSAQTLQYGGASNRLIISTFSSVAVTNCAAGEMAFIQVERVGTDGADDMTQTVNVFGAEVIITRNN